MTDLRMDWADACSLGHLTSLNRYFLLILDKGTEHWATYPSKSRGRGTPVELLKQYVLTTGRKPRYLRVDNTKEFTSQEMVDYCKDNNIILQPVAKRDEQGQLSIANTRMQPAFAGSCQTVAIPFGSRVTGYLPREHPLVKN